MGRGDYRTVGNTGQVFIPFSS